MKEDRELFDGFVPSSPPAELRARVLEAVNTGLAREVAGRWTRIWQSEPLRISWATAVALLVLAHVALSLKSPRRQESPASASAPHGGDSELARATSLPAIDSSAHAWADLSDEELIKRASRSSGTAATPSRKEKSS